MTRWAREAPTKIVHRAAHCDNAGNVSALCAKTPRPINLKRATWTLQAEAVTCPACRRLQESRDPSP